MIRYGIISLCFTSLIGCASQPTQTSWFTNTTNFYFEGVPIKEEYLYKRTSKSPRPTVIVVHGCDGIRSPSYKEWVDLLSSWGYNGIMLDSFSARGYFNLEVCSRGNLVTTEMRSTDLEKLTRYIKEQPWHKGKIGAVGFSHGGSTIMNFATNGRVSGIDAGVAYYPTCYNKSFNLIATDWRNPKFPIQMHFGEKDDWALPAWCENIEKYENYYYKNATHAFDMNLPPRTVVGHFLTYNSSADRLSRKRTKEFFEKHLLK